METTERNCPECGSTLHANATFCGCGWGKRKRGASAPIERRTVCAFETCACLAVVKVNSANLCELHYLELAQRSAEKTCERLGLKTTAQKRAWVLANSRGPKRFQDAA